MIDRAISPSAENTLLAPASRRDFFVEIYRRRRMLRLPIGDAHNERRGRGRRGRIFSRGPAKQLRACDTSATPRPPRLPR